VVVQEADSDNEVTQEVYSASNMERTWEVRCACTNIVHLRFLLPQVALHLLDSESLLLEPLIIEEFQKANFDNAGSLLDIKVTFCS